MSQAFLTNQRIGVVMAAGQLSGAHERRANGRTKGL
jgi:hypothetical protein